MGRGMTIAVLCAAGVGSVGGGLIALQVSPESSSTQPSIGSIAPASKSAVTAQPITPPDPHAALVAQIEAVLHRVPEWTRTHPGAPCPDVAALGISEVDPWGHRLELTCTDQPVDQIMGAISAGPDGIPGNLDDVKSWNLGPAVTQLVQGHRWRSASPGSNKRRQDSSSVTDRNSRPPRSGAAKPATGPRGEPIAPTSGAPSQPPAVRPTSAPTSPADAGDGIPTRR
jgi:hypothetical protein